MHPGQPGHLPRVSPDVPVGGLAASLCDAGAALPGAVDRRAPAIARGALALRLAGSGGRENLIGTLTGLDTICTFGEAITGGFSVLRTVIVAAAVVMAATGSVHAQDAAAGEKDFLVCRACHQIGPNAKIAVGPVLNGVIGRKAGPYPGYEYWRANRDSGIVWTPEELDKYLKSPQTVVPHTKMIFPGLKDEQKRKDVIAYLEQFGPDGQKKQ